MTVPLRTLMERAVAEMTAALTEVNASGAEADVTWVEFVARLRPVAHRYRVLLALRRGEYGEKWNDDLDDRHFAGFLVRILTLEFGETSGALPTS